MSGHLVISALGQDRPGIVNTLSQLIAENHGNIINSRMMVMGGEFALMLLIEIDNQQIDTLLENLPGLENKLGLTITSKKTSLTSQNNPRLSYMAEVVAMDHPGIVHEVADFFSRRNINIEEMNTDTYPAAHTGTPMFSLEMLIKLPADTSIAQLRAAYIEFCDERNLDASLEAC